MGLGTFLVSSAQEAVPGSADKQETRIQGQAAAGHSALQAAVPGSGIRMAEPTLHPGAVSSSAQERPPQESWVTVRIEFSVPPPQAESSSTARAGSLLCYLIPADLGHKCY